MSEIDFNNGYASGFAAQNSLLFQLANIIQQANIANVIHNQIFASDTSQLLNCWTRYSLIEYVETNFEALDLNLPAPENNIRNFIRIHKQNISFLTAELSVTETDNYTTYLGDMLYYTAVGNHPQAYKYFTLTDPISFYPNSENLTDIEKEAIRESYRVKIRKQLNVVAKLEIGFDEEHSMMMPKITFGSGNESGNGKGYIYKDVDGLYATYTTQTENGNRPAGTEIGLRITDNGVEGNWTESGEYARVLLEGEGGGSNGIDINTALEEAQTLQAIVLDHPVNEDDLASLPEDQEMVVIYEYDPNTVITPEQAANPAVGTEGDYNLMTVGKYIPRQNAPEEVQ